MDFTHSTACKGFIFFDMTVFSLESRETPELTETPVHKTFNAHLLLAFIHMSSYIHYAL
jgi:hypothetical protein